MQKMLEFEQLTSKVRNLLFSKIFPFFPKKNENSKFRTLLVSCSITAENVQNTIATRILLCPPFGDTNFRSALGVRWGRRAKISARVWRQRADPARRIFFTAAR